MVSGAGLVWYYISRGAARIIILYHFIMARFAVFGDSYVNHLRSYMKRCPDDNYPESFGLPGTVGWFGVSGLRSKDAQAERTFKQVLRFQPDAVFIILGGNDLIRGEICRDVADRLATFHRRLTNAGITALVAKIPWRGMVRMDRVALDEFKRMQSAVNRRLRKLLRGDLVDLHSTFGIREYKKDLIHPGIREGGCAAILQTIHRCFMSRLQC